MPVHIIQRIKVGGLPGNMPGGVPRYRARCSCRWVSGWGRSPAAALRDANDHLISVAQLLPDAGVGGSDATQV